MLSPAHNNANIANYFNSISIAAINFHLKESYFYFSYTIIRGFSISLYNLKPIE